MPEKKKLNFKIAVIVGTRPEFIKIAPVIEELQNNEIPYFLVHTGQHYSDNLYRIFFREKLLPSVKYSLNIKSTTPITQMGEMMLKLDSILKKEKPTLVLVEGDTNSVLVGAISARKKNIPVGHIEAGLRCGNLEMSEEQNRIMVDHISSLLFGPTKISYANLLREGIQRERIKITGNTIVDIVYKFRPFIIRNSSMLNYLNLKSKNYYLVTLHRAETTDHKERLSIVLQFLNKLAQDRTIIFPIHPRTRKFLRLYNLRLNKKIKLIQPQGYLNFLTLLANSVLVFTDSGGVQEEACVLNIPTITVRNETERPETILVKSNVLSGYSEKGLRVAFQKMQNASHRWPNPFGEGNAGVKIVNAIKEFFDL